MGDKLGLLPTQPWLAAAGEEPWDHTLCWQGPIARWLSNSFPQAVSWEAQSHKNATPSPQERAMGTYKPCRLYMPLCWKVTMQ